MPPDDLRCAALSSTSLQVSWQPPPVNHQNGLLQGYKVSFEPMADDHMNGNILNLYWRIWQAVRLDLKSSIFYFC